MRLKNILGKKSCLFTYSHFCDFYAFVLLLGCVFVLFLLFVLFVRVNSLRKRKKFETALITSFTLLILPQISKLGPVLMWD